MEMKVGYGSDIGRKRSQNQDNFAAHPELGLFMVADGMGGHRGGETASRIAVETVSEQIKEAHALKDWNPRSVLTEVIQSANQAIFDTSAKNVELQGMGTTVIALLIHENGGEKTLNIGHVGDSRCYYFSDGQIWQLTRDHSLVQEKLRAGLITRSDLKTDRMKNVITRSVGFEPAVNVELYEKKLESGDTFLICSDGLSGLVEDPQLLAIVSQHPGEPQEAVNALIAKANENGGDDNITVILVQVT